MEGADLPSGERVEYLQPAFVQAGQQLPVGQVELCGEAECRFVEDFAGPRPAGIIATTPAASSAARTVRLPAVTAPPPSCDAAAAA